ncbi:MAG: polysaccharide biosynthesis C-terminal domain-containing protein, partial [Fibrobacteres bacterium]|nr:polysaccharide biosynthesis C-terminal domain-containing protein [Fibrobacterota bacterium]
LDAFANAPFAELQSEHRSGYYMGLRLTHVVFYFGISVYSILIKKRTDVNAILEANIVASACQILAGLPVYLRLYKFHIHKKLMGGMIKFGLPYVPNLVFVIAIDLVDRILISRWLNMAETGYYSAAYKFANLMYMLVTAFLTAWQPFFLSNLKSEGGPNLFARVMTYYTLTTALIFLFMGLFYNEIAALSFGGFTLIGPAFRSGLTVVPILLLAYAFCGAYYNMIVGIYAKEKTWVIPIVTLFGAVLNVGLNFYAIPNYGIKGAAVVTLISYAGMTLLLYPISMKLYFIKYEWNRILHVVFIAALLYIPSLFIKSFIYKSAAFILFLPLLYVTRFFLSEESGKVKNLLIKKGILK